MYVFTRTYRQSWTLVCWLLVPTGSHELSSVLGTVPLLLYYCVIVDLFVYFILQILPRIYTHCTVYCLLYLNISSYMAWRPLGT